jgi:hypothetical protein
LILHFGTHVAGGRSDMWFFTWNIWWSTQSIAQGESPFFTPLLYYPQGASTMFTTLLLPATIFFPLLDSWVSLIPYYNSVILFGFWSSALTAYVLALYLTGSIPASFLAGLIYGFIPYRVEHAAGHPDIVMGAWLPLFLLCVLALMRSTSFLKQMAFGLAAGGCAVLGILTRPELTIAAFYMLPVLLLSGVGAKKALSWTRAAGWLAAVCLWTGALGAPYLIPFYRSGPVPKHRGFEKFQIRRGVDAASFVFPPCGGFLRSPCAHDAPLGRSGFLGYTQVALLGWAVVVMGRRRDWRFWFCSGLFFSLVSLGPTLVWQDRPSGLPLLYPFLPGIAEGRAPNRFFAVAALCFAVASALAWGLLVRKLGRPARAAGTVIVAVALLFEYVRIPFPVVRPRVSAFYRHIAKSEDRFGLVEIPNHSRSYDKLYMYYQTIHGKPIHAGHLSRVPEGTFRYIHSVPLLNFLAQDGRSEERLPEVFEVSRDLRVLERDGFRYFIFHKKFHEPMFGKVFRLNGAPSDERRSLKLPSRNTVEKRALRAIRNAIGPPQYEDDLLIVFDLRRTPRGPVELRALGDGLRRSRASGRPSD